MGGQKSKTGGNWTLTVDNFSNKLFNKYFSLFQSTCQFKVSVRKQATVIFIILTYYDIKSDKKTKLYSLFRQYIFKVYSYG